MQNIFAWASFAVSIIASVQFCYGSIKGKIKPQRVTWLLWTAISATYFAAAVRTDGAILFTLAELIGMAAVFLISLKFGTGGGSFLDIASLVIATAAFVYLLFAKDPIISLLLAIFIDAIGSVLTIKKLAKDRTSEAREPWVLALFASGFAILGLTQFTFVNLLYPVYDLILCVIIIIMVKPVAKASRKGV